MRKLLHAIIGFALISAQVIAQNTPGTVRSKSIIHTKNLIVPGSLGDSTQNNKLNLAIGGVEQGEFMVDLGDDVTICRGDEVTFDAGIADSYIWSTGETTQTISPTESGNYSVTATLGTSVSTDEVYLKVTEYPIVDLGNDTTVCAPLVLTVPFLIEHDVVIMYDEYLWSNGDTFMSTFATETGNYSVTVTYQGCVTTDEKFVTIGDPIVVDLGDDQVICEGESYTFDAGIGESYVWNTGATTQTITAYLDGVYSVTVTGDCGEDSDEVLLTVKSVGNVDLGDDIVSCNAITLDAGTGYDSYAWSTGEVTQTILVTNTGDYSVSVSKNACIASDTVYVEIVPGFDIDLGDDVEACNAIILDAGSGYDSYHWASGESTQTITVENTGDYSVTVSKNACTASDTIHVEISSGFTVDLGDDVVACVGDAIVFDAGLADSYVWSNGAVSQTITPTETGYYSVTATLGACSANDEVYLNFYQYPQAYLGPDTTVCSVGILKVPEQNDDDLPFVQNTYKWSTGEDSNSIAVNITGDYSVTVSHNGCVKSDEIHVTVMSAFIFDLGDDQVICEGESYTFDTGFDGVFKWSTGETTRSITVSESGIYSVTATESCADPVEVQLTVLPNPDLDLGDDISGCISAVLDAGAGFDTYQWSGGETSQTLTVTAGGNYSVTVSKDGCIASDIVHVEISPDITVNIGNDTLICEGSLVELHAGNADTYVWNTGATSQSILVSDPGNYSVTVTRGTCEGVDEMTLSTKVKVLPSVQIQASDDNVCEGTTIDFSIASNHNLGDNPTYEWLVNGVMKATTAFFSTNELEPNSLLTLIVTSSEQCVVKKQVEASLVPVINTRTTPMLTIEANQNIICANTAVSVTIADQESLGSNPQYNWRINGIDVNLSTETITIDTLTKNAEIELIATSSKMCITQPTVNATTHIMVQPEIVPRVEIMSDKPIYCFSDTVTVFINDSIGGGPHPSFKWYLNNELVASESVINAANFKNNDIIRVDMTSDYDCANPKIASGSLVIHIRNHSTPTVKIHGENTVCAGTEVTYAITEITNGGDAPQFSWFINDVLVDVGNQSITTDTLTHNASIKLQLESSDECAQPSIISDSIQLSISPVLVPEFTMTVLPGSLCAKTQTTFSVTDVENAGVNPEYRWFINNVEIAGSTSYIATDTLSANASVEVRLYSSEACVSPNPVSHAVKILPKPKPVIQVPTELCNKADDTEIVVSNSNTMGGTYTIKSTLQLDKKNTSFYVIPGESVVGNHEISVTWTDNNNCSGTTTKTVTIVSVDVPTVKQSYKDIIGQTPYSEFTATGSGTMHWYDDDFNELSTGSAFSPNNTCDENECHYLYYVAQKSEPVGCMSDFVAIEYIMTACPVPYPLVLPYEICEYEPIPTLEADTARDWQGYAPQGVSELYWYKQSTDDTDDFIKKGFTLPASEISPTTTTLWVRQYSPGYNCFGPAAGIAIQKIHVNPPLLKETQIKTCEGHTPYPAFEVIASDNTTVTWYKTVDTTQQAIGNQKKFIPNNDISSDTAFYVTQTIATCQSDPVRAELLVHEKMTLHIAPRIEACETDVHHISVDPPPGTNVEWYNGSGILLGNASDFKIDRSWLLLDEDVRFNAILIYNEGRCESDTMPTVYELVSSPEMPIVTGNGVICLGSHFDGLSAFAKPVVDSIVWFENNNRIGEGTSLNPDYFTGDNNYLLNVYSYHKQCSSEAAFKEVLVRKGPHPEIIGDTTFCKPELMQLFVVKNPVLESTFEWKVTGNRKMYTLADSEGDRTRFIDMLEPGVDTLFVTEADAHSCRNTDTLIFFVSPKPQAAFSVTIDDGAGIGTIRNESSEAVIETGGERYVVENTYKWNLGKDTALVTKNENMFFEKYDFGVYTITLFAHNAFACVDSISHHFSVEAFSAIHMPNAFSPTNQSVGVREFRPFGYGLYSFEIWIYDKWGNVVWYSNKLTDEGRPAEAWDGRYGENFMQQGSYIWKIEATLLNGEKWKGILQPNGKYKTQGTINLLR